MTKKKEFGEGFKHKGTISVLLFPSSRASKKYEARFYEDGKEFKKVHFGASKYEDYTTHGDEERKENYIARHGATQETIWATDPYAPATLSRFVLWNKPTLEASWQDYKQKFNLQ